MSLASLISRFTCVGYCCAFGTGPTVSLTCCTDYWDEVADLAERWTLYVNRAECQRRNDTATELLRAEANAQKHEKANILLRSVLSHFSVLFSSHAVKIRRDFFLSWIITGFSVKFFLNGTKLSLNSGSLMNH